MYDSDPELERSVLLRHITLDRLLQNLYLDTSCPPADLHNQCSLWVGSTPTIPGQQLALTNGLALRLCIRRGLRLDVSSLLHTDESLLRQTLQSAFVCDVYARAVEPAFAQHHSAADVDRTAGPDLDSQPRWMVELQHRFNHCFTLQGPDFVSTAQVVTWYINDRTHQCTTFALDSIEADAFMWRSTILAAWRDSILRATVWDFTTIDGLPEVADDMVHKPHVVLHQGLSPGLQVVLITVRCVGHDAFPDRQFAQVLPSSSSVHDVASLSLPAGFTHLPVIIQLLGVTYLPGEVFMPLAGNHILVIVGRAQTNLSPEQTADGISLLQSIITPSLRWPDTTVCKPAPFEEDTDLPMSFPTETSVFRYLNFRQIFKI